MPVKITAKKKLLLIVVLALLFRLILAFSFGTGDTGAFCQAGRFLLEEKEVYADPRVYFSAPPFGLHVTGLMIKLGRILHLSCEGMWKIPSVLGDIGIIILIYLISQRHLGFNHSKSLKMAFFYAFNPVSLFISGYHGQQEAFWLFFILLSWYLIKFHDFIILSAISASIALAYKLPSVLLIPPLIFSIKDSTLIKTWFKRCLFSIIVALIFLFSLFPEIITSQAAVIRQSFLYQSTPGIWGIGLLQELGINIKPVNHHLKILLGLMLVTYFLSELFSKKFEFFETSLGIVVLFLVFSPGFGVQYLLWPLPFLLLSQSRHFRSHTLLTTFAYLHTYQLPIGVLDSILHFLQQKIYYKYNLLYPYTLYFPVWLLLVFMASNLLKRRFIIKSLMASRGSSKCTGKQAKG